MSLDRRHLAFVPGATALFLALWAWTPAGAQGKPDIVGDISGTTAPIPIAIPDPGPEGGDLAREIVEIVREDLGFTGLFDVVDPSMYRLVPASERGEVRHEDWLSIGADAVVKTRIRVRGDDIDLEARLYDNASETELLARRYGGRPDLVRRLAHQLSDHLVEHYTGRSGIALTRIAFVSKHGDGKELYLMDYDGRRVRRLTTTGTINLAPAWSPNGDELAFLSWRGRQPGVHLISSEGRFLELNTVGGELSSSPDWAPDGRRLVYMSDVDGDPELYILDRERGKNRRLTFHPAIDTAPAFSPNGREIAFTSDRTGTPQIFLMDAEGLNVRRASWSGSYNESAAWSPSGDRLAYTSRIDGRFQIVVLDLASGNVTQLTRGRGNHENPRWSPDGRHIVFAADLTGSYDIYTMRANGSDIRRLTRGGDSFTPDWSR